MGEEPIIVDVEGVGEVEFPAGMSDAEISAAIATFDPNHFPEGYTVNEKEVERQRMNHRIRTSFPQIDPIGLIGAGPQIVGKAAPSIVKGLRSIAGRLWSGAAKSGSDDVAEQVLSRGAGRLTARNAERLATEAAATATPARAASSILDAAGRPAIAAQEAVASPLARAASTHAAAVGRGSKPSVMGRVIDAAGILGAVPTSGASLAVNVARGAARPNVRAAVAQLLYNQAPRTPEAARAAALVALMESGMLPEAAHGSGR